MKNPKTTATKHLPNGWIDIREAKPKPMQRIWCYLNVRDVHDTWYREGQMLIYWQPYTVPAPLSEFRNKKIKVKSDALQVWMVRHG